MKTEIYIPPAFLQAPHDASSRKAIPSIRSGTPFSASGKRTVFLNLRELAGESAKLSSGELMNIRCNFGTGCLSSLFGAEVFYMDRELNTLDKNRKGLYIA